MNAQFITTTTTLRHGLARALLAAFVALAVAGGTVGIVAAVNDDGNSTTAPTPAISQAAPDRVLDGSPILRGTATAAATETRVLDGSPILRGHVVTHVSSVQGTLRPPVGRPFGFRNVP